MGFPFNVCDLTQTALFLLSVPVRFVSRNLPLHFLSYPMHTQQFTTMSHPHVCNAIERGKMTPTIQTTLTLLFTFSAGVLSSAFVLPGGHQRSRQNQPLHLLNKKNDASELFDLRRPFEGFFSLDIGQDDKKKKVISTNQGASGLTGSGRSSLLLLSSALAPVAEFLDDTSDGWALSYADMRPESERTAIGQTFLATNIAYAAVGLLLSSQGELFLGFMTELVSVASFCYHYTQLQQPYSRTDDATVKLALLIDYFLAVSSILIGLFYLLEDRTLPSPEILASSGIGIGCLLACWVWEKGYPYIVLHSLWHIFSATTAYSIGLSHLSNNMTT